MFYFPTLKAEEKVYEKRDESKMSTQFGDINFVKYDF